ncbi:MAG: hypothetical protein MJZ15_09975 [Bacteroidales bacterium]|nr:hypothetical protein [Bacteroidales bacterium]
MRIKGIIKWGVLFFVGTVLLSELLLRLICGFCDAPLFQASDKYEYILQPNQDRCRFGARVATNSYSQRSEEPDSTRKIILGLGDSIIFGGTWMDQDSLATTLFTNETGVQMLNISAGSWSPDNCVAYLHEYGTFGAEAMLLVCSSHDAYDAMTFVPVVDVYPNYPSRQYPFALYELYDRYVMPYLHMMFSDPVYADPDADAQKAPDQQVVRKSLQFCPGFDQLKAVSDSLSIPLFIYLHAETGEVGQGRYNKFGRYLVEWAGSNDIPLINGIEHGETVEMYHDVLHFNEMGQRHLADVLEAELKGLVENCDE